MERLEDLPNIGKVVYRQLIQVGIESPEKLKAIGAKEAWLKIQAIDDSACLNLLYGLEGAVDGIKKSQLDFEIKADLKQFYEDHKL
ncbi:competence protein TfoX [Thomasclavelia cocleata]|uniref:DNA transformation protein n=1 Tax=Thomasclavelia cocleata TaxID=69824 RepID=A0A1I0CEK3_9FIRM|nr:TfoX/Sxy family protein [Thomasclavelia cocleata]MCR1959373.1 TfoX/Sxy family protein [Thomasclavelia cocleata]NDO42399.1 TfoX/Sxy family protein [Thomasclavelia cocleata]PJN81040.1 competence protein TfoX [Thomasclavelia cocleata]SET18005.1 DNA transformation protein [Thomasclavelia cocleata]